MRNIKLIWDFRGPAAAKTAEHHDIHLREFVETEHVTPGRTGWETINEFHAIAYLIVAEKDMIAMRDRLRPHRGVVDEG